jgi:hypothetical protein
MVLVFFVDRVDVTKRRPLTVDTRRDYIRVGR